MHYGIMGSENGSLLHQTCTRVKRATHPAKEWLSSPAVVAMSLCRRPIG